MFGIAQGSAEVHVRQRHSKVAEQGAPQSNDGEHATQYTGLVAGNEVLIGMSEYLAADILPGLLVIERPARMGIDKIIPLANGTGCRCLYVHTTRVDPWWSGSGAEPEPGGAQSVASFALGALIHRPGKRAR